jgi:hypothetical protein
MLDYERDHSIEFELHEASRLTSGSHRPSEIEFGCQSYFTEETRPWRRRKPLRRLPRRLLRSRRRSSFGGVFPR